MISDETPNELCMLNQLQTLISTSSKIMQLMSLAPAATWAFADMETFGPICAIRPQAGKLNTWNMTRLKQVN